MNYWKTCSSCKKEISFNSRYYECSVSTCSGKRTGYVFCSIPCFERHLPGARHRDAGAIEMKSPHAHEMDVNSAPSNQNAENSTPPRRIIPSSSSVSTSSAHSLSENDILIVVSKLKSYVKDKADMNTSGDVAEVLSQWVRILCGDAIDEARKEGRKTLMARDFRKIK